MIFKMDKNTMRLLLASLFFCFDFAYAVSQPSIQKNANIINQKSIEEFSNAIKTIVSLTKDRIFVNINGTIQNVSPHNFFSKKNYFPLVLLLQFNGRGRFLTYESCVTIPYNSYRKFFKDDKDPEYMRSILFKEFAEVKMGKKFTWVSVCYINRKLKFAQINNSIDWPIDNHTKKTLPFTASIWTWKKYKVASILENNGDFTSFW